MSTKERWEAAGKPSWGAWVFMEVDRLEAEVERLLAALQRVSDMCHPLDTATASDAREYIASVLTAGKREREIEAEQYQEAVDTLTGREVDSG